ncbi:MAG: holo-ACP synthase [Pseudomonadota bacterium]
MIYGIGVDILRQERIQKIWDRHGEKFADKILGDAERAEFALNKNQVRYLSMAFAAKEAFSKALGTGFRDELGFRDAGVVREDNGRPVLIYSPVLRALLSSKGISGGHVSLSDEGGMICAMVVLETAA